MEYIEKEVCKGLVKVMNTRQREYVVVLSETKKFSAAAEKLGISQPALSKQIIALENELGIKLFDRSTNPLELTAAGEFFVKKAKELLFEEDLLLKTIESYKTGENGKLVIGVSPFRSLCIMPDLVSTLKEKFPSLDIFLEEACLAETQKGMWEGKFDFAIVNLPVDEAKFETIPLEQDVPVVAIPEPMVDLLEGDICENGKITLSQCKKIPFALIGEGQELRVLFDKLCAAEKMKPNIIVEVTGVTTTREMVREGVAASFLPKQFLKKDIKRGGIKIFEIKDNNYVRRPAIILRRGQFVSKYAQEAINVLTKKK